MNISKKNESLKRLVSAKSSSSSAYSRVIGLRLKNTNMSKIDTNTKKRAKTISKGLLQPSVISMILFEIDKSKFSLKRFFKRGV